MSVDHYQFPSEEGVIAVAAVRMTKRAAMVWMRHKPDCPGGKHCEDPFCQHHAKDMCNCGLAKFVEGI